MTDIDHLPREPEIAIIGAGLAGMCMAIKLGEAGFDRFTLYEKGPTVGGTWRDNTYPGIACDVPSHLYSYSFEPNPDWSRTFSPGREIQDYCEHCADKYGVRARVRFDTEIRHAAFADGRWRLTAADGSVREADILVSGMGGLHHPKYPEIDGMDRFAGVAFHSARWDHAHDLRGKRIAVIGSAASAVQIVPRIAADAAQLCLFQRTPNWILPRHDRGYPAAIRTGFRKLPFVARLYRWLIYSVMELRWPVFRRGALPNRVARMLGLWHLRKAVPDPALRARLTPDYPPGCKRILLSDDYFETLRRDNVELVTDGIERIEADAVVTHDGTRHEVDTIVYATGFSVFDVSLGMEVVGPAGRSLAAQWQEGIEAHRTVAVPGFPNFFMLMGPNSGLGHNSVIFMIEAQVRYIVECVRAMQARGWRTLEPRAEALERFDAALQADMQKTIWQSGCKSWYQDAKGRVFTLWPHSTVRYWRTMRRPDMSEYRQHADTVPGRHP